MIKYSLNYSIRRRLLHIIDFLLIAFCIFYFNQYLVFENEFLFMDDLRMYDEALTNEFPFWQEGNREVLNPLKSHIFEIPLLELLTINPKMSRAIILFLYMIPLSFLIYSKIVYDTSKPYGTPRKLLEIPTILKPVWYSKMSLKQGLGKTNEWY